MDAAEGWVESVRLLGVEELSAYLGVPVATLYGWRHRREGPVNNGPLLTPG